MEALQAASFVVAIAFLLAFISTLRFYRGRVTKTRAEQRSALRPTLIISVSFLMGAIALFVNFYSLLIYPAFPTTFPPPLVVGVYPWEFATELLTPLFGFLVMVAVVTALRRPRLYALPVALLAVCYILSLLSPKHPMDDPFLTFWLTSSSLMIFLPMLLFLYLWASTKRPTAFGMFTGLLLYQVFYTLFSTTESEYVGVLGFYAPAEYETHILRYGVFYPFIFVGILLAVAGLSFVIWSFFYSEKKLGGELIGYSLSTAVIGTELSIILLSLGTFAIGYSITLLITAFGAGIFILTGSYLYGRYRESRHTQTLMLSIFSYFAGLSFLMFNIGQHIYLLYGRLAWFDIVTLTLGLLTGGFLFLAAITAMERRSLVLLPPAVIIPLFIMSLLFMPLPPWLLAVMAGAALLMTVLPGVMFFVLWRRMSKGKEKGRGRVLGIFLGFLFLILSSPILILSSTVPDPIAFVASIVGIAGSILAFVGSFLFYLGVSGRLDRWFHERRH
ncbi:MAG: hypothetical protein WED05_09335 [Candidatus Atabeyarchaeum deiterrae]